MGGHDPPIFMSCNLRQQTVDALRADASAKLETARVNVEYFLHNPVGVGDHAKVVETIQPLLDEIGIQAGRIMVIDEYFSQEHVH